MVALGNDWDILLREEFEREYYLSLRRFLKREYASQRIYPDMHHIFEALKQTPYAEVKAVILGQDPYHGPEQAHGLAFSVRGHVPIPPSLLNIYKELASDLNCRIPDNGCLTPWARQGVLLLNTTLTVVSGQANSHRNQGWEVFTDQILRLINKKETPVVFLLWGKPAGDKAILLDPHRHLVLKAPHPSPLSASNGFFGCRHFSKTNSFLVKQGLDSIDWQIPDLQNKPQEVSS